MIAWLRTLLAGDAARRVIRTFLIAFVGLAVPGFLGWLNDLTSWANSHGQRPFPDAHSLVYLAVSAIGAGVIAVLNAIVVMIENGSGKALLRDVPAPAKPKDQAGQVDVPLLLLILTLIGVVLLLFRVHFG